MPQMFPLLWFILFLSIFLCVAILMILTHFSANPFSPPSHSTNNQSISLAWKW